MPNSKSVALFASRPTSSAVLALLLLVMGFIMLSDLVPTSPNRRYFTGHEWLLAAICWALALFFGYCAAKGRGLRQRNGKK